METATEQEKGARKPELETGARTPVGVKVRRIQERIQKEKSHNVQQIQPTLKSFIELRGGLEGSQRRTGNQSTSSANPKAREGQGPQPDLNTKDSEIFGTMEERKTVVPGSPEHQLLKEAGALKPQGRRPKVCEETREEATARPARKCDTRKESKEERRARKFSREGISTKLGPGNSKPGL